MRSIEKIQGELRAANRRLDRAMDQRDEWVLAMRSEGVTLRAIAEAAQMTAAGVQELVRRAGAPTEGARSQSARSEAAVREWTK